MSHKLSRAARYILGLIFFIFGGAGLFNLIPPPPTMPQELQTFMGGLMAAKYFIPFLKMTEMGCGLCLLLGIAPALMLVILAPICIHIFLTHLMLTPGLHNLVLPSFILLCLGGAAKAYWPLYRPLFNRNKS